MKLNCLKLSIATITFALLGTGAYAEDKNNCEIGICHFELISNNKIDQYENILAALNKSENADSTVEIKSISKCKDLAEKQFHHMFFDGKPEKGKEELYQDPSIVITDQVLKKAIINKDFIIREVRLTVQYPGGLVKPNSPAKSTLFTLVQDKNTCELKQLIKGSPFFINK